MWILLSFNWEHWLWVYKQGELVQIPWWFSFLSSSLDATDTLSREFESSGEGRCPTESSGCQDATEIQEELKKRSIWVTKTSVAQVFISRIKNRQDYKISHKDAAARFHLLTPTPEQIWKIRSARPPTARWTRWTALREECGYLCLCVCACQPFLFALLFIWLICFVEAAWMWHKRKRSSRSAAGII